MTDKIEILYQDNDIVIVDKPALIPVFSKDISDEKDSLFGIVKNQIKNNLFPVHSIDKNASGIIIFAKNKAARSFLSAQFKDNLVKRQFIALISGTLQEEESAIEKSIAISKKEIKLDECGKKALTKYKVLEKFNGYTLVLAEPQTQIRSQIRLHFYSIGNPLAIDSKYSTNEPIFLSHFKRNYKLREKEIEKPLLSRLPLHLSQITIKMPSDNTEKTFNSNLPKDITITIKQLRKYYK
jgi:23S rRNA-/tRNA-specific pseudouridylate synthase